MDKCIPRLRFTQKGLWLIGMALRVSVVRTWKTSPRAECFGDTHQKKEQKQCINMVVQLSRASRDGPLKLLV